MRSAVFFVLAVAAVAAGAGYWAVQREFSVADAMRMAEAYMADAPSADPPPQAEVKATGPVIYYRHPDGEPEYSATPRQTDDGRAFVAVLTSEDVGFDLPDETEEQQTAAEGSGERRILYYRNPMGLPDTSPVPKKDSMGMDYIPVYEGEEVDGSTVTVSPGKLQRTGVKTELAVKAPISNPVRVPGAVLLDERLVSIVSTRTQAFVEEVPDVTTGQKIVEGQPLVRLYSQDIAAAGALYAADLKSGGGREAAKGSFQRLQNLGMPAEAIQEIEETGEVPISITLTAPRDGVVLERTAVEGMMAGPGEALFRIADISRVWVLADVPEHELGSLRLGAKATVRVRSLPGESFVGEVDLIYPEIRAATRTARVRIELPNPEGLLLANMYAQVDIETGDADPVVTVPNSAVIDTGERQVVILDRGEGRFEPRDVKVGQRGENRTEIMEGVDEGDRVVVSANFLIDAESNLNAALSAMVPPESQP